MSANNTPKNGNTSNDSPEQTDNTVPSLEQRSNRSLSKSMHPGDNTSSVLLDLTSGDPRHIKRLVTNSLIDIAEELTDKAASEASVAIIKDFIDSTSRGFVGNMPMKCKGKNCLFISACPLAKAGSKLPIGSTCPVEKAMVTIWVSKHLESLGIKDIDNPEHSFDMDLLFELAGQELIRWRCSVHLSDDPSLVSSKQVGATIQGAPIFADVISPVLEVMERAGYSIRKIREALVATREAQIKAGSETRDPSQDAAKIREKVRQKLLNRKLITATEEIKNIEESDQQK